MDKATEMCNMIIAYAQSTIGSYPALILIVAMLIWGIVKKLAKLAMLAGVCLLVWFALQYMGVDVSTMI